MRKLAAAAIAVMVCLVSAGCEFSGRPAAARETAPARIPAGQLTLAAARQAAAGWLARCDTLGQQDEPAAAGELMTGEALQAMVVNGGDCDAPTSVPRDQSFFVPIQAGYPRWFVQTARFPGQLFSTYLLAVLVQAASRQPWKAALLATTPGSDIYRPLSEIARDSQGYATAVALSDPAVAIAPDRLAAIWASLYNQGVAAANASQLIRPNDIAVYRGLQDDAVRDGPGHGFRESARQTPGSWPLYALALPGGGAEVLFTTVNTMKYLATSAATITSNFDLDSGVPEPPWTFAHNFTVPAGTRMSETTTYELVAIDPARGKGTAEVFWADQDETGFSPGSEYAATHGR
jgi:hypothetical protein